MIMISLLKGKVELKTGKFVIIDVNGVGYRVFCVLSVLAAINPGEEIRLFCHLYVREDAMDLYGFLTKEELEFFELLISISGVGPRVALGILSIAPVGRIKEAIASEKEEFLTRVSGIGTKIAKKVILELKDKLPKISDMAKAELGEEIEAIDALVGLGYREHEAREVIRKISKDIKGVENIVREALKYLGKPR